MSSNVPNRFPLQNHNVETRCVTEGLFLGVQRGEAYRDAYLLIRKDSVDDKRLTVECIPLALVKEISKFTKTVMKHVSYRPTIIRYDDGSVKVVFRGVDNLARSAR